jgi:FlaA1/EpsC-like NDP-sugar epimerase
MRRYFMTIPEAVHLVLQAAGMGIGKETFMLNMGEQVRILDLVEDLVRLSGLEPGRDIEIVFTGIRAGEKLKEDLWDDDDKIQKTDHPDVFRLDGQDQEFTGEALRTVVDELVRLAREGDPQAIITRLDELIPCAAIRRTPPPDLISID